jgi:hypothetical protein
LVRVTFGPKIQRCRDVPVGPPPYPRTRTLRTRTAQKERAARSRPSVPPLLDRSQLFKQAIDVHHIPVLGKLAVFKAKDVHCVESVFLP